MVSGKVIDRESVEPLVGAQIVLEPEGGAVTDNNIGFLLKLKEGEYSATVKYLVYEDKLEVMSTQKLNIFRD